MTNQTHLEHAIKALLKTLSLGLLVLAIGACNHLFYYPDQRVYLDISQVESPYKEGYLKTSDGESIHYWDFDPIGEEKGTVLQFHGNAQNMSSHVLYVLWLIEAGYRVISFDYRSYGKSSGQASPEGLQQDARSILDYSCQKKPKKLVVLGQSLGGAVALPAVAERDDSCVCGLVIESSFDSYRDMARDRLAQFWLSWPFQYPLSYLVFDDFAPKHYLDKLRPQTLIIHGKADPVVPFYFGQRIFDGLTVEQKEIWPIEGGGHTIAFVPNSPFRDKFVQYLGRLQCR